MVALTGLFVLGSMGICRRLLRGGLMVAEGSYRGARKAAPTAAPIRGRSGGIAGKELRLLRRDKNQLMRLVLIPLLALLFAGLTYAGSIEAYISDFRHVAAMAYGIGAFLMLSTAFLVLVSEQNALWLLYTFPRPLHRVLLRKTYLWAGIGLVLPVCILVSAIALGSAPTAQVIPLAALVVVGVVIQAFVASGIGVLGTTVLDTSKTRIVEPQYAYLFMFIAGLYAQVFFHTSAYTQFVIVAASSLLAVAIWQKVRDNVPYLLDPTQEPPPRIGVSDGLTGIVAFSLLAGVIHLLLTFDDLLPPGLGLFSSFLAASAAVTVGVLYSFWRRGVPNLLETVGIKRAAPRCSAVLAIAEGIAWGAATGAFGIGYLLLIKDTEFFADHVDEMMRVWQLQDGDFVKWFVMAGLLAAPVFEEFLFRGVLFGGLDRSLPRWAAVIASAVLFTVCHPPISFVPVFVTGVALAICYARTRWLLPAIVTHFVYNAIVFALG
jgi:hypothetical protein